jgi:AcrR family transcriptional regulator
MSTGIYINHRENQREWILEVAEGLFIQKGIEQVTIGDIAEASRLTRATIYKYFSNKEQMAQEIFKSVTKGWVERDEREVWSCQGNGYALVERFVNSHFTYLFQNPREASFVAEFNYLYAKEWPTETAMKLFAENLEGERSRLLNSVRRGQQDGSLRTDIDAELLLATILNFNSGMMSRLGELGSKVEGEYGLSVQAIFQQICRVFLDGLAAHSPQAL